MNNSWSFKKPPTQSKVMSAFLVTHLENKFIIKVHTVHGTDIFSNVAYRCQQCKGAKSKDITYHVGKLPFMTKNIFLFIIID